MSNIGEKRKIFDKNIIFFFYKNFYGGIFFL